MPDYIFMLESRLSPEQLQVLARVQQEAQELSLNIYLVGGAVRDLMTGSPIRDLDFAVEGNALKLARRLQDGKSTRMRVNETQRSVEITMANRVTLSLEMARSVSYETPGKASQIASTSILEDLRRRDFSLNSMGISLTPGSRGLLLDPTNGLADIENRELRVLHNYSFVHDPVRLLRLVRFAARLGFRSEPRTQELFDAALERGYQRYISAAALGREVEQLACEESLVPILKTLAEKGLLAVLHRDLQKRKPDNDGLAKFQKYRQQAEAAGYQLNPFVPVLHYLVKRLKGHGQGQLLRSLGLKKQMAKQVLGIGKEARRLVKLLGRQRQIGPREAYQLLTPVSIELLVFVLTEFSGNRKVQSKIHNYLFKYRPLREQLPVRELQLMGVTPGPQFDQIMEKYFEAQLDGRLRSRPQQLRFLQTLAGVGKASSKTEDGGDKSREVTVGGPPAGKKAGTANAKPRSQRQRTLGVSRRARETTEKAAAPREKPTEKKRESRRVKRRSRR